MSSMEENGTDLESMAVRLQLDARQLTRAWRSRKTLHGILADLGFRFTPKTRILDVGCGQAARVYQYRREGYEAFGVDMTTRFECVERACRELGFLGSGDEAFAQIDPDNYHFPFPDNTFDLIYSDQLFEHVHRYDEVLAEICRVLKPGGKSLHVFPPKWLVIEPHLYVPFAGGIQAKAWLGIWAALGIRNRFQKGMSVREVCRRNRKYLQNSTNYLSRRDLESHFNSYFREVTFVEDLYLKHVPRFFGRFYPIVRILPFGRPLISTFLQRAVWLSK